MTFPENLKYTKEHEWIRVEGDTAYVGITDFAQGELGELVYVEVDTVGQTIAKDEIFGTVEAVKTVSDLYMPLAGKVVELNSVLEANPEKVNEDPYGAGWMVKVEIKGTPSDLLSATQYKELIGK